jgi:hypothetical protein
MEALRWVALHCIGIVEKISMFSEQCLPNLIWAYATLNKAYLSLFEEVSGIRSERKDKTQSFIPEQGRTCCESVKINSHVELLGGLFYTSC